MTKLQKQIAACAGLHILFSLFLFILLEGGVHSDSMAPLPLIIPAIAFPIIFTVIIFNIFSKRGWIVNSETIKEKKTKSNYMAIVIITILALFSTTLFSRFEFSGGDISSTSLNFALQASISLTGVLLMLNTGDRKLGYLLMFLKIITLPATLLLSIRMIVPLMMTAMPVVFYFIGFIIFPPMVLLLMQLHHIRIHCTLLKDKRGYVAVALIFGLLAMPTMVTAPVIFENIKIQIEQRENQSTAVYKPSLTARSGQGPHAAPQSQTTTSNQNTQGVTTTQHGSGRIYTEFATVTTGFDRELGAYKTWIDLEIINDSRTWDREYVTSFYLPAGSFIIDYYLYVWGERTEGLLTDKRAAETIYEREVSRNIDPGIIYYEDDNKVTLKVFPFEPFEQRKTGFLIMHSESFETIIDGLHLNITVENAQATPIDLPGVSYIPASYKEQLRQQQDSKNLKYIFLVDASTNLANLIVESIVDYININGLVNYAIYYVNDTVSAYDGRDIVISRGESFNAGLAIDVALRELGINEHPVFIYSSFNFPVEFVGNRAIINSYPSSEYFFKMFSGHSFWAYSFANGEINESISIPMYHPSSLNYKGHEISNDNKSEIITTGVIRNYNGTAYENAIMLYAQSLQDNIDPNKQVDLVVESFRQRVMTPFTAFSAWETEQQVIDLLNLQEDMLQNPHNYVIGAQQTNEFIDDEMMMFVEIEDAEVPFSTPVADAEVPAPPPPVSAAEPVPASAPPPPMSVAEPTPVPSVAADSPARASEPTPALSSPQATPAPSTRQPAISAPTSPAEMSEMIQSDEVPLTIRESDITPFENNVMLILPARSTMSLAYLIDMFVFHRQLDIFESFFDYPASINIALSFFAGLIVFGWVMISTKISKSKAG